MQTNEHVILLEFPSFKQTILVILIYKSCNNFVVSMYMLGNAQSEKEGNK